MLKPDFTSYTIENHLLKTAVVLIDTREQENAHIIEYLEKKKIAYKTCKLDFGDYSLILPKNEQYGVIQDMRLDFAVERKHSLEELSGNFAQERDRIENELWRGHGKIAFVIENGSLDKIHNHEYKTEYNEKSFIATLCTFTHRYGVSFNFVSKENSAQTIYALLIYKLREEFK